MHKHSSHILKNPHVTEKGAMLAESGCYVFMVAQTAGKREVALAVQDVFKVIPRKVTFVRIPRKQSLTRGTNRKGQSRGGKKAYVFLKKGDKIELV